MNLFKICFLFLFVSFFENINAQADDEVEVEKKADFLLETQFYPRLNTGIFEPNIKCRIIFSDAHVLRTNMSFNYQSNKKEVLEVNGDGVGTVENLQHKYVMTLGYEYLFKNDRLSPYLGVELIAGWGKEEIYGSRTDSINFVGDLNYSSKTPISEIGIGFFSGFDFSIVEGLYIGTELGLQYLSTKRARGEYKIEDASSTTSPVVVTPLPAQTLKKLGFSGVGVIRVGWKFQ